MNPDTIMQMQKESERETFINLTLPDDGYVY